MQTQTHTHSQILHKNTQLEAIINIQAKDLEGKQNKNKKYPKLRQSVMRQNPSCFLKKVTAKHF